VTLATEPRHEHFVVLINEVEATVVGNEGSNLFAVLDELHTDSLAHGGVRLFGLDTDFLYSNALRVGSANEWVVETCGRVAFLVRLLVPALNRTQSLQMTGSLDAARFACTHCVVSNDEAK